MLPVPTCVDILVTENKSAELATIVQLELLKIDSITSKMLRCASNPKPHLARLSLHEILERSVGLIEPQLRARKIRLKRNYAAPSDIVHADAHQLEQAFLNLLLNAFDAIGQDGQITVATSARATRKKNNGSHRIEVIVRDTGNGIAKEQLSRLFEPFYTTKTNGTGL